MQSQQFEDLPQIQYFDEVRFQSWPSECYAYPYADKHQPAGFSVIDDSLCVDALNDGMWSMQPMQRFMLDQSPQSHGLLHANIPLQSQYHKQIVPQYPSIDYCRHPSPDRTSVSGTSSHASQNEAPTPYTYNVMSYGSPNESFMPSQPYHAGEHLSDTEGMPGTSISLKELEYEHHEPEPTVEETDSVDVKFESTVDSEQVSIKTEGHREGYREYTDSGIGNSVRDAESVQPVDFKHESDEDSDYSPSNKAGKRRRSAPHARAPRRRGAPRKDSLVSTSRPNKPGRRSCATLKSKTVNHGQDDCRPFPCPLAAYNCSSTFASKNEWKRHVSTQHIKLGFWRCDLCAPTTDPNDVSALYYNDFNRKDLFTQHLRRMHAPQGSGARHHKVHPVNDDNIAEHQARCYTQLRRAPQQSICPFDGCEREFIGPASWDDRMDHVGRHLEKDRRLGMDLLDVGNWKRDIALEEYLMNEELIVWEHGTWKTGDNKPRRAGSESSDDE